MTSCRPFRFWPVAAAGALLHALLLCTPLVALRGGLIDEHYWNLAVFLGMATFWCAIETAASHSETRLAIPAKGSWRVPLWVGLSLLATFWVSLVDAALSGPARLGVPMAFGALLMMLGIALRQSSIRALRKYFLNEVALLPGQPLVTNGVYGVLRHPSEAGTLCAAWGGAMLLGSEYGMLAGALLLFPAVVYRVRLEDAMLKEHYQNEFRAYAEAVPALVPRVGRTRIR